jgi:hypothetical protein
MIDLRLGNIPLAGKMFRCEHFLDRQIGPLLNITHVFPALARRDLLLVSTSW